MSSPLGAVSVAGAGSGLWSVDGGNNKVCAGLLYHSKSEVIPARVTSISFTLRPSKKGMIHHLSISITYVFFLRILTLSFPLPPFRNHKQLL